MVKIPITLNYQPKLLLNLEEDSADYLSLVSTATELFVSIDTCQSGYSVGTTAINSGVVNLYKSDRNCLVKLVSFKLGSQTYTSTGTNTVPFSDWKTPGDYATFRGASDSDLIKVFLGSQVTQTGVQTSDTISYNFTDIASTGTQSLGTATVSSGVPLSVTGQTAPNFSVTQARYLSTNSDGSVRLSFTLQCGNTLSGNSNATYACDTVLLQSQLDYILVTDTYSQGTISVAQATQVFAAGSPASISGSMIVTPGNLDSYSNIVTKGGFVTNESPALVTGTAAIYPSNLNNVLMLRRKDASGNVMSFLYFYVNLASLTQNASVSACSTTFAGGSGTASYPYLVATRAALANVNTGACASSSVHFLQVADIDLGGSATPWAQINLTGQYNGGGFKLTGLYQSTSGNVGLFGTIASTASVSNLTLQTVNITTTGGEGGALARILAGTVTNCSSSGTITTTVGSQIGGIIGTMYGGALLSRSSSSVSIVLNTSGASVYGNFGGLVGNATNGTGSGDSLIVRSYATGTITLTDTNSSNNGTENVGGLIGLVQFGSTAISNSFSTETITIPSGSYFFAGLPTHIGGLVGAGISGNFSLTGCFAAGTISQPGSGSIWAGGTVGRVQGSLVTISYTYAMVEITGNTQITSGFLGTVTNSGTVNISNSYAAPPNLTTSGTLSGFLNNSATANISTSYLYAHGTVPSQTFTGLTVYTSTADMQDQTKFDVANGGGFVFGTNVNNWKMPSANPFSPNNPSSPLLSPVQFWQCGSNGIVCP